ncbi:MAG TPA: hypothetical protein DCM27_01075 [Rhodospirillaceae bacterium]|nr:hypothetical protein [Rhodospirillaceae bacterium]
MSKTHPEQLSWQMYRGKIRLQKRQQTLPAPAQHRLLTKPSSRLRLTTGSVMLRLRPWGLQPFLPVLSRWEQDVRARHTQQQPSEPTKSVIKRLVADVTIFIAADVETTRHVMPYQKKKPVKAGFFIAV